MLVDLSEFNIFGLKSIDVLIIISGIVSFLITVYTLPKLINKMELTGFVGIDVNKKAKPKIPEMGGIAVLYGFALALATVIGVQSMFNWGDHRTQILSVIGVFLVAAFVGLIDDIGSLSTRSKILYVAFASAMISAVAPGQAVIEIPFYGILDFTAPYIAYLLFWIIIVPIGITGAANALNMSAGYNGLESGQVAIISFFLLFIAYLKNPYTGGSMIFATLLGASLALYYFNRYPAKTFVGNAGTLGMGAAVGAGVIIGKIEFFGIICILPAFYELFATAYYKIKGVRRRELCQDPIITEDGKLKPPKGSEKYTLPYYLLSKKPMNEKKLVLVLLSLYALCGLVAVIFYIIG